MSLSAGSDSISLHLFSSHPPSPPFSFLVIQSLTELLWRAINAPLPFYPSSSPFFLLPWRRLHKCQTDRRARDFVRARPSWGVPQARLLQRVVPFRWSITVPGDDFVLSKVSVWVSATKNRRARLKKCIYFARTCHVFPPARICSGQLSRARRICAGYSGE